MDTVNMANQMVNFQGKEISLDDFMIMYDNFKNMINKIFCGSFEKVKFKADDKVTLKINPDHENDYVAALQFVRDLLTAKGEPQLLRLLFQAWMVAKEDFVLLLKSIVAKSENFDSVMAEYLYLPFEGSEPMFKYNDNTKSIEVLHGDLSTIRNDNQIKNMLDYFDLFDDKDVTSIINFWKRIKLNKSTLCYHILRVLEIDRDIAKSRFDSTFKYAEEAC